MIYAFRCSSCGAKGEVERPMGQTHGPLCSCGNSEAMIRDYKAESTPIHIPAYMKGEASSASEFLPNEKDFESPSDPDGSKGMKEWKKGHELKTKAWV